jgi:DNA polymerase-3 subunit gamma/tau
MASQSLYRKWRSQNFSDLVGQEPIVQTLKNALREGTLAHAYLFTGPRGTGKTSTARLLAKTINCPNVKDGEPCNTCEQCREITIGNSFNVIEIDAASNRGIDSIRDLREKVMMPPTTGKYKVYILDEAHMLTTEAFNALLKTLEEPPPHAIFVMATTDVHKMLPTVLSRCQRFDFKRITTQQIVKHLDFVAKQEQIELEPSAAALIARAAAGGMRDALSLLDQAIAYAGQHVTLPQVQAMLGVADPRAIQKFIFHVAHLDSATGLHLINELVEAGADLYQVNKQVAEFWRAMMLTRAGADIAAIIDGTTDEVHEIKQAAELFVLEELTECARIFAQNDLVQKNQGTPQLGLELALLNSIALHRRTQNGQSATAPSASMAAAPTRPVGASFTAPTAPPPVSQSPRPEVGASFTAPAAAQDTPAPLPVPLDTVVKQDEELPDWESLSYSEDEEDIEVAPMPQATVNPPVPIVESTVMPAHRTPEQDEDTGPTLTLEDVKERWENVKRRVKTRKGGAKVAALLNGYSIVRVEAPDTLLIVIIMASSAFHYSGMQKKEDQDSVEWALKIELSRNCSVRLLPPGSAGGTILPPVIPPTPPSSMNTRAASAAPPLSPSRSAHIERPTSQDAVPPRTAAQQQEKHRTPAQEEPGTSSASDPSIPIPLHRESPALARNPVVRENSSSDSDTGGENIPRLEMKENVTTRLEFVAKKAKHDPVVQEVVRMFRADIKDVHLK